MKEVAAGGPRQMYQLGLYDPIKAHADPFELTGEFTRDDLPMLRKVVQAYNRKSASDPSVVHCLGIFAGVHSGGHSEFAKHVKSL